jgi:hypothetical protein
VRLGDVCETPERMIALPEENPGKARDRPRTQDCHAEEAKCVSDSARGQDADLVLMRAAGSPEHEDAPYCCDGSEADYEPPGQPGDQEARNEEEEERGAKDEVGAAATGFKHETRRQCFAS